MKRGPTETAKWLNKNGLIPRDPIGLDPYSCNYNCWGFTAYLLGWEEEASWLSGNTMENYLEDFTEHIEKAEPGSIAVFRDNWGELTHTALVVESQRDRVTPLLLQKPGEQDLEVRTVAETYREHTVYYRVSEYRKPIKG